MRIGLLGSGRTAGEIVREARQAEAGGFSSLWYSSVAAGDPLVAMAIAGRETARIELGTAVLQTYPCHPLLQANRVASVVDAMGRPGFTLGIGPSHEPVIRGIYGMSYDHPGRSTEEYARIVAGLLRGKPADFDGQDWSVHPDGLAVVPAYPVPVLLAALGPRLLRAAGEVADGTILWAATARAIETHVAPKILADAAIVGDEASVRTQLQAVLDAGATDILADLVPAGPDQTASLRRITDLLRDLIS
jgi:F420-dependent oxidoreductase-like protein